MVRHLVMTYGPYVAGAVAAKVLDFFADLTKDFWKKRGDKEVEIATIYDYNNEPVSRVKRPKK
jgi:hypothetical protein